MKNLILILLLLLVFTVSCGPAVPRDKVFEGDDIMMVYNVSNNTYKPKQYGKYTYYISDNTTKGWVLKSNQVFQMGDTIKISVMREY